jgi:hypothetical protein
MREGGERERRTKDIDSPWTMVVDDDNWSTTWTSHHYQQLAERRTRTAVPTRDPLSPIKSPHVPMLKKHGSAKLWCAEVDL